MLLQHDLPYILARCVRDTFRTRFQHYLVHEHAGGGDDARRGLERPEPLAAADASRLLASEAGVAVGPHSWPGVMPVGGAATTRPVAAQFQQAGRRVLGMTRFVDAAAKAQHDLLAGKLDVDGADLDEGFGAGCGGASLSGHCAEMSARALHGFIASCYGGVPSQTNHRAPARGAPTWPPRGESLDEP